MEFNFQFMQALTGGYSFIFVHFIFSIVMSFVIFILSYVFVLRYPDIEKLSSYECGFDPFETTHTNFEVRYFLVALLFIVFDVEVTFLFPWITLATYIDTFSLASMLIFFYILTLGFIYEWRCNALDFC